jgi:hypothetical protein
MLSRPIKLATAFCKAHKAKGQKLAVGRLLLIAVAGLVVGSALASSARAQSGQQNAQWCAYFTGSSTNCSFSTFEDCLQTIKGKTALCVQNAQNAPPPNSNASTGNGRRHHSAPR